MTTTTKVLLLVAGAALVAIAGVATAKVVSEDRDAPKPYVASTPRRPGAATSTTGSGPAANLQLDDAVRADLKTAFAAGTGVNPADVQGTVPGSVFYGQLNSTGDLWAVATFAPTAAASGSSSFPTAPQILRKPTGGAWTYIGPAPAPLCAPTIPAELLAVWGQPATAC